jgi:hypothetical protein
MMKKITYTIFLLFLGTFLFADSYEKAKEVRPVSSVSKSNKSFEVGGLKACTPEYDTEDAIAVFNEGKKKPVKVAQKK